MKASAMNLMPGPRPPIPMPDWVVGWIPPIMFAAAIVLAVMMLLGRDRADADASAWVLVGLTIVAAAVAFTVSAVI